MNGKVAMALLQQDFADYMPVTLTLLRNYEHQNDDLLNAYMQLGKRGLTNVVENSLFPLEPFERGEFHTARTKRAINRMHTMLEEWQAEDKKT